MTTPAPQSFASHRKFVPTYHFVLSGILLINLLWSFYRIYHTLRIGGRFDIANAVVEMLLAVGLLLVFAHLRTFPLKVQDRIIRAEMRERLARLLPADLQPRIAELSPGQLIALRFASDQELPELTRKVLTQPITRRDDIKREIRDWQADHFRL